MSECPWPLDVESCCRSTNLDPESPEDQARVASVIAQVSSMMSRWSGYTFGGCKTVRPLAPCGTCRGIDCCSGDCITLHGASGVTEVRINGVVLGEAEYHFDPAGGTLCAVPPLRFPSRDPRYSEVGSLEVDILVGSGPDAWALAVANELACELLLSCANDKACRLPKNATRVTSQGVVIELSADELRYALPSVSAWVATVNPHRAVIPARVFSPEAGSGRGAVRRARMYSPPWRR